MASNGYAEDGSQLFLVRLWADPVGQDDTGLHEEAGSTGTLTRYYHGKVQHVMTGKAAIFNDWPALLELLISMMPYNPHQPAPTDESKG